MARILFLCGLLSMGLVCRGQLNYEGNPLTEGIVYTAQESQSSKLNARQGVEVADARAINLSKRPFTPSAIDPLTPKETKPLLSSDDNDDVTKYKEVRETTTREMLVTDKGSPLMVTNHRVDTQVMSTAPSELIEPPIEPAETSITMAPEETRQLRQYPMQSVFAGIRQAPRFQEVSQSYHQIPRSYETPEESPIPVNPSAQPQNSITQQNSNEALNKFLNSRTPEESEIALQRFIAERERTSLESAQQSVGPDNSQPGQRSEPRGAPVRDTFDNEISLNYDNSHQPAENIGTLPVAGSPDFTNQVTYLTRAQYQALYSAPRWNQNGPQSRRDSVYPGVPMRRHPSYRGPIRARVVPWAQSRIAPGPPIYLKKSPLYSGPSPPASGNHHWKQPVEVIYTKPPGSSIANHPVPISGPPAAYEDASKWFPESINPPPQKDIYYSQLYAQSYDPHYYNYIAKTGKIKPWLYGKLGKSEEKSIWWELYSGFKNHGMKNMMNPMFLLGMSIPTLTLMLSALIQKRSAARAYTGLYDPQEFLEVYEPQIRAAILAYENQVNGNTPLQEKTEETRRRKRSTEQTRSPGFPSEESSEKSYAKKQQEKYDVDEEMENIERPSIGLAPPGVYPFEEYFLAHQAEFAQAIYAYGKEQQEKYDKKQKEENIVQRSIGPAPPGVYPFEEYFLTHQAEFAQAILAYEKEQQEKYDKEQKGENIVQRPSIGPAPPGVYPFEEHFLAHQADFAQAILANEKTLQEKYAEKDKKENERRRRRKKRSGEGKNKKQN